jgi:hypothetical protein
MASTIKLSDTINWSQSFGGYRFLNIGISNEPAVTSANIVLQTMIGPPFCWNWNRSSGIQFLTNAGQQDYPVSAASFGFIEKAGFVPAASITNTSLTGNIATYTAANRFSVGDKVTVVNTTNGSGIFNISYQPILTATSTQFTVAITNSNVSSAADIGTSIAGRVFEIGQIVNVLGSGSELGTPSSIAPQLDNNSGLITFSILPIPDGTYQITIIQQRRIPQLISAVSQTWNPIPDHYSYIYNWGFLSLMGAFWQDQRSQSWGQKFMASLLGAAEGLEEDQKLAFQRAWLNTMTEQQTQGMRAQQGIQARGL